MNQPKTNAIGKALKTHYAAKSLSDKQLDQLMSIQADALATQQPSDETVSTVGFGRFFPDFRSYRYAFYATACMLVVCLTVTFSLINQAPLSQRIMDEIAYNHKQGMPVEVTSNSLNDIQHYLNKLSFSMISPSTLPSPSWEFLGGRYCSINGKLAAQLKIKNLADNTIYTLYQAAAEADIEQSGTAQLSEIIDGIDVSIWYEKGLLLGLAKSL